MRAKVKVKQVIKIIIEQKECPVHGIHPTVDTSTKEIKIHACCNAFNLACTEQVNSILTGIDVSNHWKVA
jgi:transcription elongation factor Elf1